MYNLLTALGGNPVPRLDAGANPAKYPYGLMKNDATPGDGTGTPLMQESSGDNIQPFYAMLFRAGIVPDNASENVTASQVVTALENLFFAVGDIKMRYADNSPGPNWLLLNGGTFNPVDYPLLETFLGGTTLPNFSNRMAIGKGTAPLDAIGNIGGEAEHLLLSAEMPSHHHAIELSNNAAGVGNVHETGSMGGIQPTQDTEDTGGGEPHNNLPPYIVIGYFIKAK